MKFTWNINWQEGSIEEFERVSTRVNPYAAPPELLPPAAPFSLPPTPPTYSTPAPNPTIQQQQETLQQIQQLLLQTKAAIQSTTQENSRPASANQPHGFTEFSPRNFNINGADYVSGIEKMSAEEIEKLLNEGELEETQEGVIGKTSSWLNQQQNTTVWTIGIFIAIFFVYLAIKSPVVQQMIQNFLAPSPPTEQTTPSEQNQLPSSNDKPNPKESPNPSGIVPIPPTTPPKL
ncbi:hypothetical protein ACQ4M3_29050 [Leptolyngbya sp. AN03gr2]|uniref:hypothetical protein n=1 Tax=unclassified Leptolyngbya TaxID=2650499 RepID=UPI003D31600F